jgi:hypothetical protein
MLIPPKDSKLGVCSIASAIQNCVQGGGVAQEVGCLPIPVSPKKTKKKKTRNFVPRSFSLLKSVFKE